MRDESVRHGAMFLAVTEDTGIQVWPNPAMREKFQRRLGVSDLFYPDRRIAALGDREGFAVLNLAHPLTSAIRRRSMASFLHGFKNTPMGFGHWNEAGHAAAGHLIAQKLCAMTTAGAAMRKLRELGSRSGQTGLAALYEEVRRAVRWRPLGEAGKIASEGSRRGHYADAAVGHHLAIKVQRAIDHHLDAEFLARATRRRGAKFATEGGIVEQPIDGRS